MSSLFRHPNEPSSSSIDPPNDNGHVSGESHKSPLPRTIARVASSVSIPIQSLSNSQAQGMLYTSMLHDMCHDKALKELNERRAPKDLLSGDEEEVSLLASQLYSQLPPGVTQNVDLPDELTTGPQAAQFRANYLGVFSNMVGSMASVHLDAIQASPNSDVTTFNVANSSLPAVKSRLEVPNAVSLQRGRQLGFAEQVGSGSHQPLVFGQGQGPFAAPRSQYASDYQELELLGKGGYGHVFKCRNHLDNQEYAIKKILITSQRLQKSLEKDQLEALLAEVRTLAKLHHTNIVRYFHGWYETTPGTIAVVTGPIRRVEALETIPDYPSTDSGSGSAFSDRFMPEELTGAMEFGANQHMEQLLEEAQDYEDYRDDVVFGFSSKSGHSPVRNRRASHATTSSTRTLRTSILSVGEEDEDEEDDVEMIPRDPADYQQSSMSRGGRSGLHSTTSSAAQSQAQFTGSDITLFIKMSLHPMTLSAYLSLDKSLADNPEIRHCFHVHASTRILASLLDGIEYLHSQKIVHRDLKPANIFLSIHKNDPPALRGCFDINSCDQCNDGMKGKNAVMSVWITPCIGDFGLMAAIPDKPSVGSSANQSTFEPTPLAALQPKPVGTQFYRPATMPRDEPKICEKLDVYSLGVIAFELAHKFITKSERAVVLADLNKGILPKEFEAHEMAYGIKGMVCENRDKRWDTLTVREWIAHLQVKID